MEVIESQTYFATKEESDFQGQLDDSGHFVSFRGGEWKVTKRAMVIARGKK